MDITTLIEGARQGSRRDLARVLSLVEAGRDEDVRAIVGATHTSTTQAHTIGITGAPGVGKSTLTAALVTEWRTRGRTVAVLAVDPSSPFTGGALLGDRVRMADHATDDGVFIRSMASRGHLGGLSWAAPPAIGVLAAAGFDVILVETVGVGQAEVEVAALAETTLVVLAPGMGDTIQAAKAGILEVADVFVVNKADREGADRTVRELRSALELAPVEREWSPPVLSTSADRGVGVEALIDAAEAHRTWTRGSGHDAASHRLAATVQIREIVLATVRRRLTTDPLAGELAGLGEAVADGRVDPYDAADRLLGDLGT
ncbi:methylmalonyl Co-A mutase-associated GTPase MeaB [Euzebya tangerina]|uniref:methylmalonyl Co-A mutase-associated GTPase MeaB n=1 Tax=Euzebya tangerina TaxID=591198 RepID=UPI000E31C439|nr:methylmalonyl Co-A mutase-associated GTPase MeaB [Euzebya tangerina]